MEAKKQYLKGLAIRQKLVKDYPTVPDYRHQLAFSHNNLGVLASRLDQRQEGVDQIRMAIEIREKLSADFPSLAEYRHWLGANHTNLGLMLNDMDKPQEAEQQHRIALAIQEKLVTDFPTVPNYRRDLAQPQQPRTCAEDSRKATRCSGSIPPRAGNSGTTRLRLPQSAELPD